MPLIIKLLILLITPFCVDAYNFLTISDIHLNNNQSHKMRLDPDRYNEENDMDLQSFFEISHAIKDSIGEGKVIPVVPERMRSAQKQLENCPKSNPTMFPKASQK